MASIYYIRQTGRWRVMWYDADNRRRSKDGFTTEDEARAFAPPDEVVRDRARGSVARTADEMRELIASGTDRNDSGCWVWSGPLTNDGYSRMTWKPRGSDRTINGGHRVSYVLHVGPIPEGHVLDHLCRTRKCLNPEHLEAVLPIQNIWASGLTLAVKNGTKTHCPQGHIYDDANTYRYGPRSDWRLCRTCMREHSRRSALKRKVA